MTCLYLLQQTQGTSLLIHSKDGFWFAFCQHHEHTDHEQDGIQYNHCHVHQPITEKSFIFMSMCLSNYV